MYHLLHRCLEDFKVLYPLLFASALEKNLQPCMLLSQLLIYWPAIDNNEFGCGMFINLKKLFIQLIMQFY